eukprot:Amastigsp_a427_14.p7 type:complete len:120 gc:universal Amastigsp_a427_14:101-460(+)
MWPPPMCVIWPASSCACASMVGSSDAKTRRREVCTGGANAPEAITQSNSTQSSGMSSARSVEPTRGTRARSKRFLSPPRTGATSWRKAPGVNCGRVVTRGVRADARRCIGGSASASTSQ